MTAPGWGLRGLNIVAILATLALITLGGVVRVTDSGLGCPDWPLCHGQIIPPFEFHVLIEYSHRLMASLVSVLVVAMGIVAWWRYRTNPWVVVPVTLSVLFLIGEVALGGVTVLMELPPTIVTVHLAIAQAILALLLVTLVLTWRAPVVQGTGRLFWWALAAAGGTYVVTLSGSYVVGSSATFACLAWPLCDTGLLPSGELAWVHMAHRLLAALVGAAVLWSALLSWRERPRVPLMGGFGVLVAGLLLAQVLMGAANPWTGFLPWVRAVHLSLATVLWGSLVVLVLLAYQGMAWRALPRGTHLWRGVPAGASSDLSAEGVLRTGLRPWRSVLSDYVSLTKPRIMVMLLVTALGGMILAAEGIPSVGLVLTVLVGGALASGGASALNHWLDQDIDQKMSRTHGRPVASLRVPTGHAIAFGLVLTALAFLVLWLGANLLSGLLAMGGTVLYVLVYTQWLKRSTTQNIVIGGAAGAMPPLVGWAAVMGGLDVPAFYLFALIFFWTPPHFWALALLIRDDYAAAGVPMLPVVEGEATARRAILLYTLLLLPLTVLFFLVTSILGLLYLGGGLLLGVGFVFYALRLLQRQERVFAARVYRYSLLYLALLFAVIMVDAAL